MAIHGLHDFLATAGYGERLGEVDLQRHKGWDYPRPWPVLRSDGKSSRAAQFSTPCVAPGTAAAAAFIAGTPTLAMLAAIYVGLTQTRMRQRPAF
ncbi:hypothetical protein APV28_3404 [Comamonas testosteroni]|nr:hypothetical protein APV28_3404 [Comamonas testosteroni]